MTHSSCHDFINSRELFMGVLFHLSSHELRVLMFSWIKVVIQTLFSIWVSLGVMRNLPQLQVFHIMLSLSQYSSPYTGVKLFFVYLLWVQLQLHQGCYRSSCCWWMYRAAAPEPGSNCWMPIRHDAESGRNVWSDAPPSCFSLKMIGAF